MADVFFEVTSQFAPSEPRPATPEILRALELLGVRDGTAASVCGISKPVFSFWKTGKNPIPEKHKTSLRRLLAQACDVARVNLGGLATATDPGRRAHFEMMRHRLIQAEEILRRGGP